MNQAVLEQKFQALRRYRRLDTASLEKLESLVPSWESWDFVRMNPYAIAEKHGFTVDKLMDIMIHGVKVGLFDFHYAQVCPGCGGIEHKHSSLDELSEDILFCSVCNRDVQMTVDDLVEVSFLPSESLDIELPDPLANQGNYLRMFHSDNMVPSEEREASMRNSFIAFASAAPDDKASIAFTVEAGAEYRVLNFESHKQILITGLTKPQDVEQIVDLDLLPNGFSPKDLSLRPGKVVLKINNKFKSSVGMILQTYSAYKLVAFNFARRNNVDPGTEAEAKLYMSTVTWKRFLTGKDLLNNQSFRDLFRIQQLAPDMKLKIKSLTVLFTDLKGSTDMYAKVGDYNAYNVVQEHFDILTDIVRSHKGAIVKTMGDAIMATFSRSTDAVLASLDMITKINRLKAKGSTGTEGLGIKIGIHEGPALAVNADDRIDYFGQNINLAARVQGIAEAGEVWFTDAVYQSPGVASALSKAHRATERKIATLKGISGKTVVHKLVAV